MVLQEDQEVAANGFGFIIIVDLVKAFIINFKGLIRSWYAFKKIRCGCATDDFFEAGCLH